MNNEKTESNSIENIMIKPKENRSVGVVLNEKQLAKYLGTSRYFVTLLRKRYGLKYVVLQGMHNIYYYLPMVDEFFRNKSKSDDNGDESDNPDMTVVSEVSLPETLEPLPVTEAKGTRTMHFKPMRQI